ncbi:MAG: hypothetical protein OXK76_02680 [Gammaproteobacteria bacterium]|nr:hypothetical protein [Gammaproteobacteria bacterium]
MRATLRRRVTRRSFLAGTAAASAAGLSAALSRRAGAVGPHAIRRPNFLFLVPDQHRYDWIGRIPAVAVPTPNLEALAARGVDFSRGGRWRMVADPRHKLIDGFFEDRTLFDLERDPMETENVAATKPGVVARLEKRFASA